MYPKNAASPPEVDLGQILQLSDGAIQTSGASVRVKIGTGAWGAGAGTLSCDATSGVWTYLPTQAETNADYFIVGVYKASCSALSKTVITSASATAGYAGVDWSKIAANTTTVNLSGTTVKTATDVETDTQDIQSRLPAALVSGRMDASVGAMASNTLTASALATDAVGEIADGVWDEPYAGHTTAGSFGKIMDLLRKANLTIDGTVSNAITPTTLTFSSNVSATTSAYAHAVLLFVSGPLAGENSPIISYNNTNGVFVLEEPLTAAPSDGDEFVIIAGSHVHAIADIQSGLATTAQLTTVENKVDAIDDFVDTEVAAIKATTDKLDTTVELDGVVYRFTTNALEQAPSGGGGGGTSIMVTPVVAQTPVRVVGSNIETFIGDLSDIRVGVFSGTDPVDLSGFGDLEVCVQERDGTDLDLVPMADLTIDGDSNEYVTWTPNGPSVSQVRRGKWSLRKVSNKQVIGYGSWIVVDAALGDGS